MSSPTPPGMDPKRWTRLLDVARQMDDRANRGASTRPWAAAEPKESR